MPDTGWLEFTAAAAVARSGSNGTWANVSNALTGSSTYAEIDTDKNDYSPFLRVTNMETYYFPPGCTLDGIQIYANFTTPYDNDWVDDDIHLVLNGSANGNDFSSSLDWNGIRYYGGSTSTWNTWPIFTISNVIDSTFGFQVSVLNDGTDSDSYARVYEIYVKIFYTLSTVSVPTIIIF